MSVEKLLTIIGEEADLEVIEITANSTYLADPGGIGVIVVANSELDWGQSEDEQE